MNELPLAGAGNKPPPVGNLSILQHLTDCYKLWFEFKKHIEKSAKYTLGKKIDTLFIETLELIFIAQYLKKEQKLPALQKANTKFDTLKFFLKISWETKNLSIKHYALLAEPINGIGKMLGGWLKKLQADAAREAAQTATRAQSANKERQ